MATLAIASIIHWATKDPHSTVLKHNWALRPESALETATAIFYGVCIAFLGVTGMELAHVSYRSHGIYTRRVRMHAVIYRGYPPKGLPLHTAEPDHRLSRSQHRALFLCVRIASDERHCRRHERPVRPW